MKYKITVLIAIFGLVGTLPAQKSVVNRTQEAADFPDLRSTEERMETNIQDANERLATMSQLVEQAKKDRQSVFDEVEHPLDFRYTDRNLRYTPRNTYIRFVSEQMTPQADGRTFTSADFILAGFGNSEELMGKIREKVNEAKAGGVAASEIAFANRNGMELTQYEFIYRDDSHERRVVGSRRKSLALYFKQGAAAAPDQAQNLVLDMVVTRVVEDDLAAGVRDIELVIDPTPLTKQMDDVIILHRYNQKPTNVVLLGAMANTPTNPHRVRFKQKFYLKLLEHFYRLYRLVDGYANRDSNDYNEQVIEHVEEGMSY